MRAADAEVMTVAALSFEPIFFYVSLGLAGVVAVSRVLVGWALAV
jgi:hypothetical protein